MDKDDLMKEVLEAEKKLREKKKEEKKEEGGEGTLEKYIQKLLKKTGMENLKDILIYSKTEAGWRAWLEKYTGTFTEFLQLYNYAEYAFGLKKKKFRFL